MKQPPPSSTLTCCVEAYIALYKKPLGPRANVYRRRLAWYLPRLSPRESDLYYQRILKWRLEYEKPKPDPGLDWTGVA